MSELLQYPRHLYGDHGPEVISEIQRRMTRTVERAERRATNAVTTESVFQDMADLEEAIKQIGMGAWQSAALLKIIEMRAKILKLFSDAPQVNVNALVIENLLEGRRRAGLVIAEEVKQLPEVAETPENIAPELDMSVSFRPDEPVAPPETSPEAALEADIV